MFISFSRCPRALNSSAAPLLLPARSVRGAAGRDSSAPLEEGRTTTADGYEYIIARVCCRRPPPRMMAMLLGTPLPVRSTSDTPALRLSRRHTTSGERRPARSKEQSIARLLPAHRRPPVVPLLRLWRPRLRFRRPPLFHCTYSKRAVAAATHWAVAVCRKARAFATLMVGNILV